MKPRLTTISLILGLALGFGPWVLIDSPSHWWYPISVAGGLLAAISGLGAQMKQLGQGDTGDELLRSVWSWVKTKVKSSRS